MCLSFFAVIVPKDWSFSNTWGSISESLMTIFVFPFLKSNPNFLASLSGSELFDRIEIFESTLCFVIFSCFFRS